MQNNLLTPTLNEQNESACEVNELLHIFCVYYLFIVKLKKLRMVLHYFKYMNDLPIYIKYNVIIYAYHIIFNS